MGLAKAFPKASFLQDSDVPFSAARRLRFWSVFGPFGATVRCVWLFWRVRFWFVPGAPKCRAAEASARLISPAQPSPDQPSPAQPGPSLGVGLAKALPKPFILQDSDVPFSAPRQLRFWSVFGPFGATVPLRLAVLEGSFLVRSWRAKVPPSRAKRHAKPSPAQPSPDQLSPAQARPKPWCGPCQSSPKGFLFYRIQTSRFRPPDSSVFGSFLARLGPPCRCVWLFWRVRFWFVPGAPKCRAAEASARLISPAQPSPDQPSPAQPGPSLGVGLAKALPKPFILQDSDVPFSAPRQLRFGPFLARLGPPCRCVWLFWRVRFWFVPGAPKCRPAEPSAMLSPAQPSPAQPSRDQLSPAQARPKPWCGPCQSSPKGFFLQDSDVPFSAPRRLRFWCVFGPFGAAVPLRLAVLEGPCLVRSWRAKVPPSRPKHARLCVFGAQPSPVQPSPAHTAQPKPWCGPCQSSAKGFFLFCPTLFPTGFRRTVFQPSPAQPS